MEEGETKDYELLPEDYPTYDYSFKIIVIGNSGVGKSSLSIQASRHTFADNYFATVGVEFYTMNIKLNEKVVKLQIWDTCGQEIYRSLISNFYRNSSLAIIVYSITDQSSFESIDQWLKELKLNSSPDIKIFLIGNKIDLQDKREVSTEQGKNMQNDYNLDLFIESSAKNGHNTEFIFAQAAKLLYTDYNKYKIGNPLLGRLKDNKINNRLKKENVKQNIQNKKKCC